MEIYFPFTSHDQIINEKTSRKLRLNKMQITYTQQQKKYNKNWSVFTSNIRRRGNNTGPVCYIVPLGIIFRTPHIFVTPYSFSYNSPYIFSGTSPSSYFFVDPSATIWFPFRTPPPSRISNGIALRIKRVIQKLFFRKVNMNLQGP